MACGSCGTGGCSTGGGCNNNGLCASGSCNKMNSYDWVSTMDLNDPDEYEFVEVSFKNGSRKEFYKNPTRCITGDVVLVEANGGGYDIGTIALSGELVRLQLRKKDTPESKVNFTVIRKANERDLERLENKLTLEKEAMLQSRAIARTLDLDIKIGDVEYQGDMKKATFFFTANGRVDFRELVKAYAKEFKVKIEMRQIGSRQESARIGGIGVCGRELCCSTWLSDFRSVNTSAARYQNIAINQSKLSGQCGRLKCCLNYELDSYVDALQHFPNNANILFTKKANASLVKTDIFKGLMYYVYDDISMRGVFHALDKEKVKEILELNKKGVKPEDLVNYTQVKENTEIEFDEDLTGAIELPANKKKKKKKPQGGGNQQQNQGQPRQVSDKPRQENRPQQNNTQQKQQNPNAPKPENRQQQNNNQNKPNQDSPRQDNRQNNNQQERRNQDNKNPNQQNRNENPNQNKGNNIQQNNDNTKNVVDRRNEMAEPKSDNVPPLTPPAEGGNTPNPNQQKKKKFWNKNKDKNRKQ